MEETHLKAIAEGIDDLLNFLVQTLPFYDDVVFDHQCIFNSSVQGLFYDIEVSHVGADGTHVKICDIRPLDFRVVEHFQSFLEIFRVDFVLELTSGLDNSRVFPVDHLDRYGLVVTREEIPLSGCLIFHGQKKSLELVLRLLQDDVERQDEK